MALRYLKEDISVNLQTATKGQLITVSIKAGQTIQVPGYSLSWQDGEGKRWYECTIWASGINGYAPIPVYEHQIDLDRLVDDQPE